MKVILIIVVNAFFCYSEEWVKKYAFDFADVRKIECFDNICIAAIGDVGITKVIKSYDYGDTWDLIYEFDHFANDDTFNTLLYVEILDTNNIYLTYDRLVLDYSNNGGKTFTRKTFGELSKQEAQRPLTIRMFNEKIGLMTNYFNLIYTKDGWETYRVVSSEPFGNAGHRCFFLDSTKVIMQSNRINTSSMVQFDFTDESWSWYYKNPEDDDGDRNKSFYDICRINERLFFACGSQFTGENQLSTDIIWKSTDSGKSWKIIFEDILEPKFGLQRIAFKNEFQGIALGPWGKVLETKDGGDTWELIPFPEEMIGKLGWRVAWAGDYPLISADNTGIYRREKISSNDYLIIEKPYSINNNVLKLDSYQIAELDLFNTKGQLVDHKQVIRELDLKYLKSGLYLLSIKVKGNYYSEKIIIN